MVEHSELAGAADPDAVRAALAANSELIAHAGHAHGGSDLTSVREAEYRKHRIVVRTRYEITVDGQPFDVQLTVDNAGRVHYHGLPTRDFASVIGLVEKAIDVFPGDFAETPGDDADAHSGHGKHDHGGGH